MDEELSPASILQAIYRLEVKLADITADLGLVRTKLEHATQSAILRDDSAVESINSEKTVLPAFGSFKEENPLSEVLEPAEATPGEPLEREHAVVVPLAHHTSQSGLSKADRQQARKEVRQRETELSRSTSEIAQYQVTTDKWSASARALICEARYLLRRIEELGMESNTALEDLQTLSQLIRDTRRHPEFFGCNLTRYVETSGWNELSNSYECLSEAIPLIETLEQRQGDRTKRWREAFIEAAEAEARVYKLIEQHAPDCKDDVQMSAHSRLLAIQGDIYVPAWAGSTGVEKITVTPASLVATWGRLQKPQIDAQKTEPRVSHVNLIDTEAVLDLHWELVRFFQAESDPIDPPGPRDQGLLESALSRPSTSYAGTEKYETVTHKAAALTHSLILNHPFHNGNKRTALASMVLFLRKNDLILTADEDELFSFMLQLAAGDLLGGRRDADDEVNAVREFIHTHSAPIGQPKAMKFSIFLKRCEKAGCLVRRSGDKRSWIIRNGKKSLTLQASIGELAGPVVKVYVSRLGLTEAHSGIHLDTFSAEGDLSPQGIIAKYNRLLKRLAAY